MGDAYVNLKKNAEARDAYEKCLALYPNGKSAPDVRLLLAAALSLPLTSPARAQWRG